MSSAWKDWHLRKERIVEPEVSKLEQLFKEDNVKRILDAGCGAGRHTIHFAKKGFELYGFDDDEEALAHAKHVLQEANLKADLRVWNMTRPWPYQNDFFDAVIAVRVIHHTLNSNILKIVSEIDRVLRPGGYLFLQVPGYESETFDPGTMWAEPGTLIARGGPEKGVPHHYFKKNELLETFSDYTVKEIHYKSDHYGGYCLIVQKNNAVDME